MRMVECTCVRSTKQCVKIVKRGIMVMDILTVHAHGAAAACKHMRTCRLFACTVHTWHASHTPVCLLSPNMSPL